MIIKEPFTISSDREVLAPPFWSSVSAGKAMVVPAFRVRVTPAGTVTSPVRETAPLHVSSDVMVPDVVGRLVSMFIVTRVAGACTTLFLSVVRVSMVWGPTSVNTAL